MNMFKSIFKINIILIFIYLLLSTSLRSEIIDEINVEGNQRISKDTIIMFADVSIKDELSDKDLNEILKKLYNTNFFDLVSVKIINKILTIKVKKIQLYKI